MKLKAHLRVYNEMEYCRCWYESKAKKLGIAFSGPKRARQEQTGKSMRQERKGIIFHDIGVRALHVAIKNLSVTT